MTTAAAAVTGNNRRLALTIYRSMMRWCNDVDPSIPLTDLFIEYSNRNGGAVSTVLGTRIMQQQQDGDVRDVIRESFRREGGDTKERIAEAMAALRHLNELKPLLDGTSSTAQSSSLVDHLVGILAQDDDDGGIFDVEDDDDINVEKNLKTNDEWTEKLINTVEWLPTIDEMVSASSESSQENDEATTTDGDDTSILPLFPLGGPLYSPTTDGAPLPLFTAVSDIPHPGMEISLKIFEPRYRQLYQDILTSGSKKFVVPFCHPTIPTKYARHGLLYEVVHVKEVADETNGVIQYLANHLVTKPIYIDRIVNLEASAGGGDEYMKVQGRVVNDEFPNETAYEPLQRMLQDWAADTETASSDNRLPQRALHGLESEGLWGFVNIWNMYLQQELLNLQVTVAGAIQVKETEETVTTVEERDQRRLQLTKEFQQPHRARLLSLQLDIALLVPTLLQEGDDDDNHQHQIEYLLGVIAKEREYLVKQATKSIVDDADETTTTVE